MSEYNQQFTIFSFVDVQSRGLDIDRISKPYWVHSCISMYISHVSPKYVWLNSYIQTLIQLTQIYSTNCVTEAELIMQGEKEAMGLKTIDVAEAKSTRVKANRREAKASSIHRPRQKFIGGPYRKVNGPQRGQVPSIVNLGGTKEGKWEG